MGSQKRQLPEFLRFISLFIPVFGSPFEFLSGQAPPVSFLNCSYDQLPSQTCFNLLKLLYTVDPRALVHQPSEPKIQEYLNGRLLIGALERGQGFGFVSPPGLLYLFACPAKPSYVSSTMSNQNQDLRSLAPILLIFCGLLCVYLLASPQ